ncbi:MAG: hypothetical protein ACFB6R_00220 [Alphaproteobacteria bacterium]
MLNPDSLTADRAPPPIECAVVGHRASGKTALISALLKLSDQSFHSFAEAHPIFLPAHETLARPEPSPEDTDDGDPVADQVITALRNGGHFAPTHDTFVVSHPIRADYYGLSAAPAGRKDKGRGSSPDRGGPDDSRQLRTREMTVLDIAGPLLFPDTESRARTPMRSRSLILEAEARLMSARTVILCLPATYLAHSDAHVGLHYARLLNRMRAVDCRLERLIICLTKYESRWAAYGRDAIRAALDPAEFHRAAFEVVSDDDALRRSLIGLAAKKTTAGRAVEIVLCPVSVYGFVLRNGCANFDLHQDGMLIQAPGPEGFTKRRRSFPLYPEEEARRYWQPFLIVDPFMSALTGRHGQLTFSLDTIV